MRSIAKGPAGDARQVTVNNVGPTLPRVHAPSLTGRPPVQRSVASPGEHQEPGGVTAIE